MCSINQTLHKNLLSARCLLYVVHMGRKEASIRCWRYFRLYLIVKSIWRDIICKSLRHEWLMSVSVKVENFRTTPTISVILAWYSLMKNHQIDGDFRSICHSNHFYFKQEYLMKSLSSLCFFLPMKRKKGKRFPVRFCAETNNFFSFSFSFRTELSIVFYTLFVPLRTQ